MYGWDSSWDSPDDVGGTRRGVVSDGSGVSSSNRIAIDNGELFRDHGVYGPEPQAKGEERQVLLCFVVTLDRTVWKFDKITKDLMMLDA